MFYVQEVLAKKGLLAKVWLAAHWDSKLTKAQILATDISKSVESILKYNQSDNKKRKEMSLRLQAHLLLGLVRIYVRQVKYLKDDCDVAINKLATISEDKPTKSKPAIDLQKEAAAAQINLRPAEPTSFDSQDMPVFPDDDQPWTLHTAPAQDITMRDDQGTRSQDYDQLREEPEDTRRRSMLEPFGEEDEPQYGIDVGGIREEDAMGTPQRGMGEREKPNEDALQRLSINQEQDKSKESGSDEEGGHKRSRQSDQDRNLIGKQDEGVAPLPKKRKIDEELSLSDKQMRDQIANPSGTLRDVVPAPATKKSMLHRQSQFDGAASRLHRPLIQGLPAELSALLTRTMESGQLTQPRSPEGVQPASPDRNEPPGGIREEDEIEAPQFGIDVGIGDDYQDVGSQVVREATQPSQPETQVEPFNVDKNKETFRLWFENEAENDYISFFESTKNYLRQDAAQVFYGLLHLKTQGLVEVKQEAPYHDIFVYRRDL